MSERVIRAHHAYWPMPAGESSRQLTELLETARTVVAESGAGREVAAALEFALQIARGEHLEYVSVTGGAQMQFSGRVAQDLLNDACAAPTAWAREKLCADGDTPQPLYAVALSNATTALQLALMAYGAAGGEVVVPSFNYPGMPNTITLAGATPRFVDVDPRDWHASVEAIVAACGPQTRAIVVVGMNQSFDLQRLESALAAHARHIPIIHDASLSVGARYHNVPVGALHLRANDCTIMSFATTKTIAALGGALLFTSDRALAEQIAQRSHLGVQWTIPTTVAREGMNARMCEWHAVAGLAQWTQRDTLFAMRRERRAWYDAALTALRDRGLVQLPHVDAEGMIAHYMVAFPKHDAAHVVRAMWETYRVECAQWIAHHQQPLFTRADAVIGAQATSNTISVTAIPSASGGGVGASAHSHVGGALPHTEWLAAHHCYLPFHLHLTMDDVTQVMQSLTNILLE